MTVVIIIHVAMCVALIGIILLQPGKSDMGIGFGSSSQSIFGSKGAGNFLTKATAVFAGIFLLTSFLITKSRMDDVSKSVIDTEAGIPATQTQEKKAETKPGTDGASATMPAAKDAPKKEGANENK